MMMKRALTAGAAAVVATLALSAPAQAQLLTPLNPVVDCAVEPNPGLFAPGYTACSGAWDGNNLNQEAAVFNEITTNQGWLTGTITTPDGDPDFDGPYGTLNFNDTYTNFVLALKQASGFSLYYFAGSFNSISYSTAGVQSGADDDLSHWTLYAGENMSVPEPGMLLLLGTGLVGMAAVRRRREDIA